MMCSMNPFVKVQTIAAIAACVDAGICKVASQEAFDVLVTDFLNHEQDPSLEKVAEYLLKLPLETEKCAAETMDKRAFLLPMGSKVLGSMRNLAKSIKFPQGGISAYAPKINQGIDQVKNFAKSIKFPQEGLSAYKPQIKSFAKSVLPGMAVGGIAGGYMGNQSFNNKQFMNSLSAYNQQQPIYNPQQYTY